MHNQFVTTSPKRPPAAQRNINNNIKGMRTMQIGGGGEQQKPLADKENLQPAATTTTTSEKEKKTNLGFVMSRAKQRLGADAEQSDYNQFFESGDVGKDLYNFARFHRIDEPLVVVTTRKTKGARGPEFYCSIKVDGQTFLSYPDEFYDEQSATVHLSKKVLATLMQKYGRARRQSLPVSTPQAILERVPRLVGEHYNGVWSWQVEANYRDMYREAPPPDWLEILDASPTLTVENFVNNFVLRLCTPEDRLQKGKAHSALECGVSIPTSSATFDEKGFMTAKITCPVSAGEIWCRQVDTTEAADFESLMDHMNRYYQDAANEQAADAPVSRLVKGHYCAAWWDQSWQRAQILEVRDAGVLCQLVDRGDDCLVPLEKVRALRRTYARAKAQAFVCRLAGLDALHEASQFADAIGELEGATVTLEMVDGAGGAGAHQVVAVVMYDRATGVACNKELLASIAMENATPSFDLEKSFEVHVSHISPKGSFYVQTRSAGFEVFLRLLEELEGDVPEYLARRPRPPPPTPQNAKEKLYFARLDADARYRRVKIIDWAPNLQFAQVIEVDTGRASVVRLSDVALLPMEELSPILSKFPPQATLVRLHLRREPDGAVADKLRELIPQHAAVLLRVQGRDAEGLPSVMVFVPNLSGLVSVNDSLEFKDAQLSPHSRLATPPDSPHNVPSTGFLQCPRIPKSREYFEVRVPFAVNPWNFFVQPRESAGQLAEMTSKLQATFANRHADPVNLKDIRPGSVYAARREADDAWCRVCVLKTIYPSAIVVFYVDFGNYANLSYQDLFALDKHFLDLPYQALKAKLAGIKPIQEKWSVDNCRYFEQLVQQREYVSVIKSVERDELYPCDNVLVLTLVDTTSQLDVVIGDLLIQKKIAVKA